MPALGRASRFTKGGKAKEAAVSVVVPVPESHLLGTPCLRPPRVLKHTRAVQSTDLLLKDVDIPQYSP